MKEKQLAPQQMRIVSLIARGYGSEEILKILSIRRSTYYNHMKAIRAKTGIRSYVLLAFYALGKGIVTQEEIKKAIRRHKHEHV